MMKPLVVDANLIIGATGGFVAGAGITLLVCIIIFGWLLSIKSEKEDKDRRIHPQAL
jgi:hypothetical protein